MGKVRYDRLDRLYWVVAIVLAVCYLWVHHKASFFCPVPWPDEGQFLWPAISFQRSNTLFSPQLNPDIHVMWMPPGYMVWHGILFKSTGFSFRLARWLSAVYVLGGMYFFLRITREYALRWIALLLAGAYLLSKWFIFSGNIARMEALIILMACASFFLLQRRHYYKALILLSISPLVHPNGLYFCAGAGLYFLLRVYQHPQERRCSISDILLMIVPVVLWAGYLVYVGYHWDEFRVHMPFQFVFKSKLLKFEGGIGEVVLRPDHFLGILALVACMICTWAKELPFGLLGVFAASMKLLIVTTTSEQYGVYDSFFWLTLSILIILVLSNVLIQTHKPAMVRFTAIGVVLVGLLGVGYGIDQLGIPTERWSRSSIFGRIPPSHDAYVSSEEEKQIRDFISSLRSSRPINVQFHPQSEALFFHDLDGDNVRFFHPTFYTCVDPNTHWTIYKRAPDVHIIHLSEHITERLYEHMSLHVGILSLVYMPESDLGRLPLLFRRSETESWHYFIASADVVRE